MPTSLIIAACGALFFIGHLLEAVFRRHRIPDVLPLILLGALAGPGFRLIEPRGVTAVEHVFGQLALIVILFHGGLELPLGTLKAHAGSALKVSAVLLLANSVAVVLLSRVVFHQAWGTGLLLGVILSPLAATVAIPMLEHLPFSSATASILTLESALGDVAAVVGVITLSQVLGGDGSFASAPFRFAGSLLGAATVGLGAAVMWSLILRRIQRQAKTTFATEALLLVVAGGLEWAGLSGAIGALAFGVGLRNLDHLPAGFVGWLNLDPQGLSQTELDVLAEAVFILKVFYFFYLGTLLRFGSLDSLLAGLLVCLVLLLIRQVFFRKAAPPSSAPWEAGLLGWMIPRGLASAVLAGVPAEHGLPGALWIRGVAIAAIPLSILMTALGIWLNRQRIPRL
jgi:NhaP-type Na+/H+ or K+/H+ antiporter